jgi:hypothetical protein
MNAVEIEQAISELAELPFDAEEFPYAFLTAFGNKATTIARLRAGSTNKSDLGGVLQTNNVHLKVCECGAVDETLKALRESPATTKGKVKFIVATDGELFAAEELSSGEVISCDYATFPDHFGFFLTLAGISTVKQIRESAFDIRATSRLNRLYVQLLKDNPDWGTAEKRTEHRFPVVERNHDPARALGDDEFIVGGQFPRGNHHSRNLDLRSRHLGGEVRRARRLESVGRHVCVILVRNIHRCHG